MVGALVGAGATIIGGLIKSARAKKEEKRINEAIDNFNRQDFVNVADNLSVSTLGAELAKEQSDITTATILESLRKGGARTLLSGIGSVQAQSNNVGQRIQADLDSRQKEIDRIRATDEARIRNLQENREIADLAGLGNALNVARQDKAAGTSDIFSGITGAAGSLFSGGALSNIFGGAKTVSELSPSGITPLTTTGIQPISLG